MLDSPARTVPVATPSAAASGGSCTVPDSDPKISHLVAPAYTEAMRQRNKAGIVDVTVLLTATGAISKAVVTRSSGDDLLDGATYDAAVATTYDPEVKSCTYVAGSYIFRARFRSEPRSAGDTPATTATEKPPFAPQPVPPPVASPGASAPAASPSPAPAPSPSAAPVPSPTAH